MAATLLVQANHLCSREERGPDRAKSVADCTPRTSGDGQNLSANGVTAAMNVLSREGEES